MSLSNRTESTPSPAQRYFEWSAQDGKVKYYDKEAKENVYVKLPFKFLVLDILSTVKGYSDSDESGLWSNEVRDTRTDTLTVRSKRGIKAQGLYQDVKQVQGARFTQSVYIAFRNDDNELVIGNFQMHGVTNSAFIEFRKLNKQIYGATVAIIGSTEGKKGATKFQVPTFQISTAADETVAEAIELDKELQAYLTSYLGKKQETVEVIEDDFGFTGTPQDRPMPEYTDAEAPDDVDDSIPF